MKNKKKPAKKKTQKRVLKKRLMYGCAVIAVVALALFIYSSSQRPANQTDIFPFKAAIVDHLSKGGVIPWPNQTFINSSRNILIDAGFTVFYYSYEESNVDFYRNIATNGFGLIIFRVHSAIVANSTYLGLFTSEPYDESKMQQDGPYWEDYKYKDALVIASYNSSGPFFFGISPAFVRYRMQGRFQNTIVILMGCDGLKYTVYESMAAAFVGKGARVCIGWDRTVDAQRTDEATYNLLRYLVTYQHNVSNAVDETMRVIGADPRYGSILTYYPDYAGNYIIPVFTNLSLDIVGITIFLARETERISLI